MLHNSSRKRRKKNEKKGNDDRCISSVNTVVTSVKVKCNTGKGVPQWVKIQRLRHRLLLETVLELMLWMEYLPQWPNAELQLKEILSSPRFLSNSNRLNFLNNTIWYKVYKSNT